jgi:hypothetical protein
VKREASDRYEEYTTVGEMKYSEYRYTLEQYVEEYRQSVEEMRQSVEEMREMIERRWEESEMKRWLDNLLQRVTMGYEQISRDVLVKMEEMERMPLYKELMSLRELNKLPYIVMEEAKWAVKYWQVEENVRRMIDERLQSLLALAEWRQYVDQYVKFEPETGNIFVTVPLPLEVKSFDSLPLVDASRWFSMLDLRGLFYTFKPTMDMFNWIPPFKAHAMISGRQHYMTFDKKFYDFAGACSYVLANDFIDGNFTVVVNYDGDNAQTVKKSISVISQEKEIEIFPDFSVNMDDTPVEMPIEYRNTTITREGSTIRVHSNNGITVVCRTVWHLQQREIRRFSDI